MSVHVQELLKHSKEERYRSELKEALDSMLKLLKSVNDSMHQIAITGYQVPTTSINKEEKVDNYVRFMTLHYSIKAFVSLSAQSDCNTVTQMCVETKGIMFFIFSIFHSFSFYLHCYITSGIGNY